MRKFLRSVIESAKTSTNKNHRHGCIITCGGKILVRGTNSSDGFCHAETAALMKLCEKIPKNKRINCKLLVVKVNKHNNLTNSEPCQMCTKLIQASGIQSVIYSNENGILIRKKSNDLNGTYITNGFKKMSERMDVSRRVHYLTMGIQKHK